MVSTAEILKSSKKEHIKILFYLLLPFDCSTVNIQLMNDIVYAKQMSGNLQKS